MNSHYIMVYYVMLCTWLFCIFYCNILLISDGYKILSAKPISKGAGLDPLRAQRIAPPDDKALIKITPQIVSVS